MTYNSKQNKTKQKTKKKKKQKTKNKKKKQKKKQKQKKKKKNSLNGILWILVAKQRWKLSWFFLTLRKHAYSNILKISHPKNWKFSDKNSDIFHISAKNINCGYSLEPRRF